MKTLGPYQLLRKMAAGGMAEIWEACPVERPTERVALKTLPTGGTPPSPAELRKFIAEAHISSGLRHPNVVHTFDVGVQGEQLYLAMELLQGRTLAELRQLKALPLGLVVGLAAQLLSGLSYAHGVQGGGLVHRDIKPSNLFVTDGGVAKIIDFGIAILPGVDRTLTRTGLLRGSLPYCSPEQVNHVPLDARSDLFSLGGVLYELLTGERAFPQTSEAAILAAILWTPVSPVGAARQDVPEWLHQLVQQLLRKAPEERPVSASAALETLTQSCPPELCWDAQQIRDYLARFPVAAVKTWETASIELPISVPTGVNPLSAEVPSAFVRLPAPRPPRPHVLAAVAGAGLVLLLGASAALTWSHRNTAASMPTANTAVSPLIADTAAARKPLGGPETSSPAPTPAMTPVPESSKAELPKPKPGARPHVAHPATAKRAGSAEQLGWITVGTRGGWANVLLDGKSLGPTPLFRLPVEAGRHVIDAKRPDGVPLKRRTVVVQQAHESKVLLDL